MNSPAFGGYAGRRFLGNGAGEHWMRLAEAGAVTDEAEHVLAHVGVPGTCGGGTFVATLLEAIELADPTQRAGLAIGFPADVALYRAVSHDPAALARLSAAARPR